MGKVRRVWNKVKRIFGKESILFVECGKHKKVRWSMVCRHILDEPERVYQVYTEPLQGDEEIIAAPVLWCQICEREREKRLDNEGWTDVVDRFGISCLNCRERLILSIEKNLGKIIDITKTNLN